MLVVYSRIRRGYTSTDLTLSYAQHKSDPKQACSSVGTHECYGRVVGQGHRSKFQHT